MSGGNDRMGEEKRSMGACIEIFFSYAHKDKELCEELEKRLSVLKRQGTISIWYDRYIPAGSERKREIEKHLSTAQIIVLLVSPDFLASDDCYNVEMKKAIERKKRGETRVIPVLLRPTTLNDTPLQQLESLPINKRPVTSWHQRDQAFYHVAEGIKKVVRDLLGEPENRKSKQQEKSKSAPPQDKKMDRPSGAPPAQNKKSRPLATTPAKPVPLAQQSNNQISPVFYGPLREAIVGVTNTVYINTTSPLIEEAAVKWRDNVKRGYDALSRKDYALAKQWLEAADQAPSKSPAEAAQIKYYTALALLNGQRPFSVSITLPVMQQIEQTLRAAIALQPLHSYYYTLALFKYDFARNGLPQYKQDARSLMREAQRINSTKTDKENIQLLRLCQSGLVNDAQRLDR